MINIKGMARSGAVLGTLLALQACVEHPPSEIAPADASASLQAQDAASFAEPYLRHPLAWTSPKVESWGSRTIGSISPTQAGLGLTFPQSPFGRAALQFCQFQGGDHFWTAPDGGGTLYWCTDGAEDIAYFGFKLYSGGGLLWLNVLSRGSQVSPADFTRQMAAEYRFRTLEARNKEVAASAAASAAEQDATQRRAQDIQDSRARIDLSRGARVCRYGTLHFGTYTGTYFGQARYQNHEFEGAIEGRIDELSEDRKKIKIMVTHFSNPPSVAGFSIDTPVQVGSLSVPNHQNTLVWDDVLSWGACL